MNRARMLGGVVLSLVSAATAATAGSVAQKDSYTLTVVRELGPWQSSTVTPLTQGQYEMLLPLIRARAQSVGAMFSGLEAVICGAGTQNGAALQQNGTADVAAILQYGTQNSAAVSQGGRDDAAYTVQAGSGLVAISEQSGSHDIMFVTQLNRCSRPVVSPAAFAVHPAPMATPSPRLGIGNDAGRKFERAPLAWRARTEGLARP